MDSTICDAQRLRLLSSYTTFSPHHPHSSSAVFTAQLNQSGHCFWYPGTETQSHDYLADTPIK
eukprot:3440592-Rhodomonas_salina.1